MTDNTPRPELSEDQIANLAYLRIKIKHLAVEPGIIREEHTKRRRHATKHGYGYSKWLEVRTRVHRISSVRPEARAALLAYAFIRGKSYGQTEQQGKNLDKKPMVPALCVPIIRISELVLRYGNLPAGTTKKEAADLVWNWVKATGFEEAQAA